jgi:hypothetical protein
MKPKLTVVRWRTIKKLEQFQYQVFTAAEADVHGASLFSLEECGWIERADPPKDLPFAVATQGHHWRVTETGREVIAVLPNEPPRRM